MWFKVYFHMVSVVYVVLTIKSSIEGTPLFHTLHLVDSNLTFFALVGLFGYLYKKDFLTKKILEGVYLCLYWVASTLPDFFGVPTT